MDINTLKQFFTYHAPSKAQIPRYERIRAAALAFGTVLLESAPSGPDQSAAIRKLRECVMTANASIALENESLPVALEALAMHHQANMTPTAPEHTREVCRNMHSPGSGCAPGCPYED